jgi:L-threonylcarbamoyladenylate synthase
MSTHTNISKQGKDIEKAKVFLEQGKLVAIPTETVYGLAANALDEKAVLSIFKVKNRPSFDPLIVHTNSLERIKDYVTEIPEKAQIIAQKLMPGALTLLLPKKDIIPDLVTSGLPHVAIRIPKHPLTLALLESLPFPLAAPSANPFGYISPTTAQHVADQLGNQIAYILDGGACEIGLESTIIGFENDQVTVFRKGGIAIETIEALIGKVHLQAHSSSNPQAPGMLKSHYAPKTPFFLGDIDKLLVNYLQQDLPNIAKNSPEIRIGLLSFYKKKTEQKYLETFTQKELPCHLQFVQEILSPSQDFSEAAHNLFAAMRRLDSLGLTAIFAELLPEKDLGSAMNDRLRRAATRD